MISRPGACGRKNLLLCGTEAEEVDKTFDCRAGGFQRDVGQGQGGKAVIVQGVEAFGIFFAELLGFPQMLRDISEFKATLGDSGSSGDD